MIINESKRWLVITPPRTGSTTLTTWLCRPSFGGHVVHGEEGNHNVEIPRHARWFRVYLAVRNPFARASSLYRWQRDAVPFPQQRSGFRDFIDRVLMGRDGLGVHRKTLSDWWPGEAIPIRLEDTGVIHENADPTGEHWMTVYDRDPDAWAAVTVWAAEDCRRFGYEMRV